MKVYLVRHGDAVSSQVDPQRPLSEQGRADIRKIASYIKPQRIFVEYIWHSGKLRAAQTAEILAESVSVKKDCSARNNMSPNDDIGIIADELEAYDTNLMLIGHLPFLAYLASLLVSGKDVSNIVAFDAGAIVCLSRSDPSRWQIEWMISPKLLD